MASRICQTRPECISCWSLVRRSRFGSRATSNLVIGMKHGKRWIHGLVATALVAVGTSGGTAASSDLLAMSETPELSRPKAEGIGPVECKVVGGPLGEAMACRKEVYLVTISEDVLLIQRCRLSGVATIIQETDDSVEVTVVCRYDCPMNQGGAAQ